MVGWSVPLCSGGGMNLVDFLPLNQISNQISSGQQQKLSEILTFVVDIFLSHPLSCLFKSKCCTGTGAEIKWVIPFWPLFAFILESIKKWLRVLPQPLALSPILFPPLVAAKFSPEIPKLSKGWFCFNLCPWSQTRECLLSEYTSHIHGLFHWFSGGIPAEMFALWKAGYIKNAEVRQYSVFWWNIFSGQQSDCYFEQNQQPKERQGRTQWRLFQNTYPGLILYCLPSKPGSSSVSVYPIKWQC